MSAGIYLEEARALASTCIARERMRYGGNVDEARERLARRIGWAPGTLYNLMRDRLKKLDTDLRHRLTEYAIEDLRNEIAALSRELESASRLGRTQDPSMVCKAEAVLAEARELHARLAKGALQ